MNEEPEKRPVMQNATTIGVKLRPPMKKSSPRTARFRATFPMPTRRSVYSSASPTIQYPAVVIILLSPCRSGDDPHGFSESAGGRAFRHDRPVDLNGDAGVAQQ